MTTSPSGIISNTEELLRTTIAACSAFQTWTGESSEAGAKTHIYLAGLPLSSGRSDHYTRQEIEGLRPFAIVYTGRESGFNMRRDSVTDAAAYSGTLLAYFEENVSASIANDYAEVERRFLNSLGDILKSGDKNNPGLEELLNTAGYLHWNSIVLEGPWRATEDEVTTVGDYQAAAFRIAWGVQ